MKSRRHGGKPTLALWTLVAIADLAMLVAASGVLVGLAILAALAGGVTTACLLFRRLVPAMTRPLPRRRGETPARRGETPWHSVIRYSPGRVDRRCDRPLGQAARRPA